MLQIKIPKTELWDEKNEVFIINNKEQILTLEHSLLSISKWESKWKKPFLSKDEKTDAETIDYIRCMTITSNVDSTVYNFIDSKIIEQVNNYIDDPMTATWFNDKEKSNSRQIITSELIYYWMIALNIPWETQKWHLNRLLTLIKVCNIKNAPPKKMSMNEVINRNAAINKARKAKYNTKG